MSARAGAPAIEESVACNLIPMIDIMFLLLLFFMLGADMSQRELEEVALPTADRSEPEDPIRSPDLHRTTVNVFHATEGVGSVCAVRAAGGRCRDPAHWRIAIRGSMFTLDGVLAPLTEDAVFDAEPGESGAARPPASRREVMIRSDRDAPYGVLRQLIMQCAAAGLSRISIGTSLPEGAPPPSLR